MSPTADKRKVSNKQECSAFTTYVNTQQSTHKWLHKECQRIFMLHPLWSCHNDNRFFFLIPRQFRAIFKTGKVSLYSHVSMCDNNITPLCHSAPIHIQQLASRMNINFFPFLCTLWMWTFVTMLRNTNYLRKFPSKFRE